ncbi:Torsin-1B-like protein, partial [Dinothrombium tinctorium]
TIKSEFKNLKLDNDENSGDLLVFVDRETSDRICSHFNSDWSHGDYQWRNEKRQSRQWIHFDDHTFHALEQDLSDKLHAQPLVQNLVVKALRSHFADTNPSKPLVLSFHGPWGVGKNFAAYLIADRLYKKGRDSKFVQHISATVLFPDKFADSDLVSEYQAELRNIVTQKVANCGRQLFIIDEVDRIATGVLDGLQQFLISNDEINGVDCRKAVFILISNVGADRIASVAYDFWRKGKERNEIKVNDIISNEEQTPFGNNLFKNIAIDYIVPFLPLEKSHIKLCIIDYMRKRYKGNEIDDEAFLEKKLDFTQSSKNRYKLSTAFIFLPQVADSLLYFPPDSKMYSTYGCKRVQAKVPLFIEELNSNQTEHK